MNKANLRLRVALAFTVVFSLIVCAFGITLYLAASDMEDTMVDQLLDGEANYIAERLRADPGMTPPMSSNLKTWLVRTPADAANLPKHLRDLGPGQHEVFPDGGEIHVTVRDAAGARIYAAYDVSLNEQRLERFKWLIALCVLAVVVISLCAGYWLAGVLLGQLTDLAATVDALTPGAQTFTLARDGQDAEVARLARAFDNYQQRLAAVLRREQEFTADANHELRTPLTAILTSCELLAADAQLTAKSRERIMLIGDAASRMKAQLESLLFLAREQALATEPVNIAECVQDVAGVHSAEAAQCGVRIEIDVTPDANLNINREALRLVLSNLLRNALRHTRHGSVCIQWRAPRMSVSDTGSGIAPGDLPRVFERYYRGSSDNADGGAGLGLAIVRRVCDQCGWTIGVDSAPGRGSTFTLTLREQ